MSAAQAETAHNAAFARAKRWLQDQLVPQVLIDKLFSLPSTEAYWLTTEDFNTLGFRAPWYEEWLLARCPGYVEAERQAVFHTGHAAGDYVKQMYSNQQKCENDALGPEIGSVLRRYVLEFPLTGKGRDVFVTPYKEHCISQELAGKLNAGVSRNTVGAYCSCEASYIADNVSAGQIMYEDSKSWLPPLLPKAADYCVKNLNKYQR